MVISVMAVEEKAPFPILLRPLERVTLLRLRQKANAEFPILLTV
jgi:hypothetical protein